MSGMSHLFADHSLERSPVCPGTARKRSMRRLRKPDKVRRELYRKALQQSKCESTVLRTTLSGVGALSA